MEISQARDWIIVIVGILETILLIGLIIIILVIYSKINKIIKKGKEAVQKIEETIDKTEKTVASPYFKIGAWLFRVIAAALGGSKKRKSKEERGNGR